MGFKVADLPAVVAPPAPYVLVDITNNGEPPYITRTYIYEYVVWERFNASQYDTMTRERPELDDETRTYTWRAVDKQDQDAAMTALQTTPTAGADYIVFGVPIRDNRNGSITIEQVCQKAKQRDGVEQAQEISAFETTARAQDRNLPTIPTFPSAQTPGIIETWTLRLNEYLKWVKDVVTRTMTLKTEAVRTSISSDNFTETIEKFHNADSIPSATDVPNTITQIEGGMNAAQKNDYVKSVKTVRVPSSCPAAVNFVVYGEYYTTEGFTTTVPAGQTIDGVFVHYRPYTWHSATYKWHKKATHSISFALTAAAAAAVVTGGDEGSGISPAGDWLWMARKVVRFDDFVGSVTYTDPGTRIRQDAPA